MASQRTFALVNGMTVEKIGEHLVDWFQMNKNNGGGRRQSPGRWLFCSGEGSRRWVEKDFRIDEGYPCAIDKG